MTENVNKKSTSKLNMKFSNSKIYFYITLLTTELSRKIGTNLDGFLALNHIFQIRVSKIVKTNHTLIHMHTG